MTRPPDRWASQADRSAVNHADVDHHDFGQEHDHKPTKAIIGLGALILLSFLLYEINGKAHGEPIAAATSNITTTVSGR